MTDRTDPHEQDTAHKVAANEARQTLDHQITWAMQSDTDMMKLLRYNFLAAGAIGSILSFLLGQTQSSFPTVASGLSSLIGIFGVAAGIGIWLVSIVLTIVTYNSLKVFPGPIDIQWKNRKGPDLISLSEEVLDSDIETSDGRLESEHQYYKRAVRVFDGVLRYNTKVVNQRYDLHVGIISLMFLALLELLFGIGAVFTPVGFFRGIFAFLVIALFLIALVIGTIFIYAAKDFASTDFLPTV